jgi:hypothetical protein
MPGHGHKSTSVGGPHQESYKEEMQRKGISVPPADVPRAMVPNPRTHTDPGLGAKTLAHPFKSGKTPI